jgi:hypothetical protein
LYFDCSTSFWWIDVAVGHAVARAFGPDQVEDVLHPLQVHGQALDAVGDLAEYRLAGQRTDFLEIGELSDFHAVQPDFPAESPGAQRRAFPVILDEADVVCRGIDAERAQRLEVEILDVVRRGLQDHLILVVVLQAVRVLAVATVLRAARRLHVGSAFHGSGPMARRKVAVWKVPAPTSMS